MLPINNYDSRLTAPLQCTKKDVYLQVSWSSAINLSFLYPSLPSDFISILLSSESKFTDDRSPTISKTKSEGIQSTSIKIGPSGRGKYGWFYVGHISPRSAAYDSGNLLSDKSRRIWIQPSRSRGMVPKSALGKITSCTKTTGLILYSGLEAG